jgi:membrane-associated phospholipid phosphatase
MNARLIIKLTLWALAIVAAHVVEHVWFDALLATRTHLEDDLTRLLRIMGYVPTWLAVAVMFVLVDRARRDRLTGVLRGWATRGALLMLGVLAAGALAELGKILLRRERPGFMFEYAFRPWDIEPLSSSGLGLPSSHTAVAFGAACMIARLHGPTAPIILAMAAGCGVTRILAGAHFLSDVTVGAFVGWMATSALWALHLRNVRRDATTAHASGGGGA